MSCGCPACDDMPARMSGQCVTRLRDLHRPSIASLADPCTPAAASFHSARVKLYNLGPPPLPSGGIRAVSPTWPKQMRSARCLRAWTARARLALIQPRWGGTPPSWWA